MNQVNAETSTSTKPNGNGKTTTGEVKATKTIAIQVPIDLHELVTAKADELDYSVNSVGKALFVKWVDGKVEIPVPIEKVKADLTAEMTEMLNSDPSRADAIKKFLVELGKKNQGSK